MRLELEDLNEAQRRQALEQWCEQERQLLLSQIPQPEGKALALLQTQLDQIEQQALRREVRLEIPVIVEVVPGQVREHGQVEPRCRDPSLRQGMGRDLGNDRLGTAIAHLSQ